MAEEKKGKWANFDENADNPENIEENEEVTEEAVDEEEQLLADDHEAELSPEQQKYNELEEKYTQAQDEAIRLRAEMENIRRRAQGQVEDAHKYGAQKFAENMLSVLDGFDGALQNEKPDNEQAASLYDGLQMTHDLFLKSLQKCGVKEVCPEVGEPFNPQMHEAMTMQQDPSASPNSILQVLRKGYEINGRVIRAAMVVVNQG